MIISKSIRSGVFGIMCASALLASASPSLATQSANASVDIAPKTIDIVAKKYQFAPSEILLKKGEPVLLHLTSEDRSHGFLVKPLNVDADIAPGKTTEVRVTPDASGEFTVICDHYCGLGHGGMKMKISVVP